jgi:hypothetical protein
VNQNKGGVTERVDSDVVVAMGMEREETVVRRVGTNLWHLDLGQRFLDAVERREACDGRQRGCVSAWTLKVEVLVALVSALARIGPRGSGGSVSPLEEWRRVDSEETG